MGTTAVSLTPPHNNSVNRSGGGGGGNIRAETSVTHSTETAAGSPPAKPNNSSSPQQQGQREEGELYASPDYTAVSRATLSPQERKDVEEAIASSAHTGLSREEQEDLDLAIASSLSLSESGRGCEEVGGGSFTHAATTAGGTATVSENSDHSMQQGRGGVSILPAATEDSLLEAAYPTTASAGSNTSAHTSPHREGQVVTPSSTIIEQG